METYDDAWVTAQVAHTIEAWHDSGWRPSQRAHLYGSAEQENRERAYDEALQAAERELRLPPETSPEQSGMEDRLVASFGQFAARALDLDGEAINLLTQEFLPVGTELARRARRFDAGLGMGEIIQAARNAWTACGLQPLMGRTVTLTPSIFGYSLMYPYSDNYLDDDDITVETKRQFSRRFRRRLLGEPLQAANDRERAIWKLIALVELQYPRPRFPRVFECLLAIHQAQERSINQLAMADSNTHTEVLHLSCAKGGTSVLADACLARGTLNKPESQFAFQWGVLLQLGDDLQDVRDDMRRGSTTVFSQAVAARKPLDQLALQLLRFSENVGKRMDELPHGTRTLKELLKMSWRSLIIRAIADSHEFFSPGFVLEAERHSPFRFDFLRRRSDRLAGRNGLYATIFYQLTESGGGHDDWSPGGVSDCIPDPGTGPSELLLVSE